MSALNVSNIVNEWIEKKLNLSDFKEICRAVSDSQNIESLDIGMNDMGGDLSLKEVANMITKTKSLTSLNLDKMNINMDNYEIIMDAIIENKTIQKYYFSYNSNLKPIIALKVFYGLDNLTYLEFVPYDKDNDNEKDKDFSLEEKKFLETFKKEKPNVTLRLK